MPKYFILFYYHIYLPQLIWNSSACHKCAPGRQGIVCTQAGPNWVTVGPVSTPLLRILGPNTIGGSPAWFKQKRPTTHIWSDFHSLKLSPSGFGQNRHLGYWVLHCCFFLPLEQRRETTRPIRFPSPEAFAARFGQNMCLGYWVLYRCFFLLRCSSLRFDLRLLISAW